MICRHCGNERMWQRRGLCWTCSQDKSIFDSYPSESKFTPDVGVGKFNGTGKPCTPTNHPPGSPGKVAVLVARAAAGQQLWHPADAKTPCTLSV